MSKRVEILPKKKASEISAEVADIAIKSLRSNENKNKTHRITFDMPMYLYEIMKERMNKKGDTMRNYMVNLIRKDVGDE
jgi:hypothetical protein